ncbi:MAG: hypothetical protein M1370_06475 [Bacteroidetes bacterium]|nr:hypothetical protein [Bacteroidota bacterium]MCL5027006.1 hypothetical protein [Chloroflexota bacterium]
MKGIQFITNERGKKVAVVISLAEWGEEWEDFYDNLVAEERNGEPTVKWKDLKAGMNQESPASG